MVGLSCSNGLKEFQTGLKCLKSLLSLVFWRLMFPTLSLHLRTFLTVFLTLLFIDSPRALGLGASVCTEYIFGKVWDHLFYRRKRGFWLVRVVGESHTHNALGETICSQKQTVTHSVQVWILTKLLSSSGFYKESCRSAAATSLTSNTYTTRVQLKETDTTVWLRVVLLVYPTWHMWSQVLRPMIPLKWLIQTAGCSSKGIYSSQCHPSLVW